MPTLAGYLHEVVEKGGSDLHFAAGAPPIMRLHGELVRLRDEPLSAADTEETLLAILSPEQQAQLRRSKNIDFACELPVGDGTQRTRVNVYYQKRGLDGVFRLIAAKPPTVAQLELPDIVAAMTRHHQGLVLVTGPAGSGRSSTLAAMVAQINSEQPRHIITIEDPIEYIHQPDRSLINQRQVGVHAESFARALRAAVREDPDVIMVGELRDTESIALAITAAETGHLVLATLHTPSAAKTIDRLLEAFPPGQQPQLRAMLAESMRGIISQQLLTRLDGKGRALALEILVGCMPVANMIRDNKTYQIPSLIQTGRHLGMRPMEDSIQQLLQKGLISKATALELAADSKSIRSHIEREHGVEPKGSLKQMHGHEGVS
jgi:twitching motility protein PilT